MNRRFFHRHGIGFVEVVIAVLVVAVSAIPVIQMVTASRKDTTSAINYLRAVELANELVEWASVARFSELDAGSFSAFTRSLCEYDSDKLKPGAVHVVAPENPVWKNDMLMADALQYSEQYGNAYFFREVRFEDVNESYLKPKLLKKMVVTVKWNEGKVPANINVGEDRNRQVELSVLILNDENLTY